MSSNSSSPPGSEPRSIVLEGIAGSAGYAIGRAIVIDTRRHGIVRRHVAKHAADDELERFDRAVDHAARELREAEERARARGTRLETSILEAYLLMVSDQTLRSDVERRIRIDLLCAEWALSTVIEEMAGQLRSAGDPYLAERSHDFEFVADRILGALTGRTSLFALPTDRPPGILVAHDLSPAEAVGLTRDRVLGIVTEVGTRTSHTAILARTLEIPTVVGAAGLLGRIADGDMLAVDGVHGHVVVNPFPELIAQIQERADRFHAAALARQKLRDRPIVTRCGVSIEVRANIELPSEAEPALIQGARGVGLYRTEFLYVERSEPPSEEEHFDTYRRVMETVSPLPVTLRTFDIGGDKFVSALQVPKDMNPALGLRAVRLGLARPEIFLTQLRAMIRASAYGPLRIMVPMIASLGELRAVRQLFNRALAEVDGRAQARASHIPLGMMVEVPSAALMANEFAHEAEFFSIGTNDLVQYALAVDRSSPELAYLASFFDPAVLRLIGLVIKAGLDHDRPVALCGAMASDPLAAVLLVGLGLRELSMEASAIPRLREVLSAVSLPEAADAAQEAMRQLTAQDIEHLLLQRFRERLDLE
ncbi:MAG TPA: phosphoenolpyruvate--protein phosphotransferase [Polyangiaceae bacterium]|nr:phosphoenolpyruvate--protein phosphotransferase [Polyangiaceae bacterium]